MLNTHNNHLIEIDRRVSFCNSSDLFEEIKIPLTTSVCFKLKNSKIGYLPFLYQRRWIIIKDNQTDFWIIKNAVNYVTLEDIMSKIEDDDILDILLFNLSDLSKL